MAERIARDLVVSGRVQGVFYRAFVASAAARHGVGGRAVNRSDGSVAIHLEGPPEAVAAVSAACEHGSERAVVERVDASDGEDEGLTGFATG